MYPPFWFSMLKYKIGYAHIIGRNSRSTNIRKPCLISQGPLLAANRKLIQLILTTPSSANFMSMHYSALYFPPSSLDLTSKIGYPLVDFLKKPPTIILPAINTQINPTPTPNNVPTPIPYPHAYDHVK